MNVTTLSKKRLNPALYIINHIIANVHDLLLLALLAQANHFINLISDLLRVGLVYIEVGRHIIAGIYLIW